MPVCNHCLQEKDETNLAGDGRLLVSGTLRVRTASTNTTKSIMKGLVGKDTCSK